MPAITKIDRAACKAIDQKAEAALQAVATELGLLLKPRGGTFDPGTGTFTPKFEFSLPGAAKAEFERSVKSLTTFGDKWITGDDYEVEVTVAGRRFQLVGCNLRAKKYPFDIREVATGELRRVDEFTLRAALGR
jgi:hypothetical protein